MEVENYLWCVANAMSVDYSMARAKAPATIASAGLFHPEGLSYKLEPLYVIRYYN